jgi:signal peptidase II
MFQRLEGNEVHLRVKKDLIFFTIPASVVIILDQASKIIVAGSIKYYESVPVIDGFFHLVHVRNRGMVFGLFNNSDAQSFFYLLVSATIVAIIPLFLWFITLKGKDGKMIFGLSLVVGGAIGNLIDRLRIREVIDFLDFFIGEYHWPAFNLADSSITVGVFWILINLFFFGIQDSKRAE